MRVLFRSAPIALLLLTPQLAVAQSGLANLIPNLILREIVLPGGDDPGRPHAGHFTLLNPTAGNSQPASIASGQAIGAVVAFNDRFRSQFANFPLSTSAGGFTYTFDPSVGTYARASESFGPSFTERATTIGRRKLGLGFNYQHSSFDTFGGEDLSGGEITFYLPHTDCCSPAAPPPSPLVPGFEGDVLEAALDLRATVDTFAFFLNYGVTNRWDVGLALPISRVELDADVHATILRLSSGNTNVHTFTDGQNDIDEGFTESGSATGIGDVVLRTKYHLLSRGAGGVAAAFDLRLPTGDEDDLLGLGTTQGKVYVVLSAGNERFGSHLNVGFTASGSGTRTTLGTFTSPGISDEFNLNGAVEFVASPRLTLTGDYIGRTLFDAGKVSAQPRTFQFRAGPGAPITAPIETSSTNPLTGAPYRELALRDGHLNLALGAVGLKYNAATNLLITGNVLFPFTKGGLRDTLTFALGFDYAF